MKVRTQYQCEMCGCIYNKAALAEKCEQRHFKPTTIIGVRWDRGTDLVPMYPLYIDIETPDGVLTYKLENCNKWERID